MMRATVLHNLIKRELAEELRRLGFRRDGGHVSVWRRRHTDESDLLITFDLGGRSWSELLGTGFHGELELTERPDAKYGGYGERRLFHELMDPAEREECIRIFNGVMRRGLERLDAYLRIPSPSPGQAYMQQAVLEDLELYREAFSPVDTVTVRGRLFEFYDESDVIRWCRFFHAHVADWVERFIADLPA